MSHSQSAHVACTRGPFGGVEIVCGGDHHCLTHVGEDLVNAAKLNQQDIHHDLLGAHGEGLDLHDIPSGDDGYDSQVCWNIELWRQDIPLGQPPEEDSYWDKENAEPTRPYEGCPLQPSGCPPALWSQPDGSDYDTTRLPGGEVYRYNEVSDDGESLYVNNPDDTYSDIGRKHPPSPVELDSDDDHPKDNGCMRTWKTATIQSFDIGSILRLSQVSAFVNFFHLVMLTDSYDPAGS